MPRPGVPGRLRGPDPWLRWMVTACVAASAAAYLRWSQELRFELGPSEYQRTLLQQFAQQRGFSAVHLIHPVSASGALLLGAFVLACAAAGAAVRRAFGRDGGIAATFAFACGAAVIPPAMIASVRWPDGRGGVQSMPLLAGALIIAMIGALVAWRRASLTAALPHLIPPASNSGEDCDRAWAIVLVVALVPLALAVWWNGIDAIRGFDSLADHLPRAARWLRLGALSDESGTLLTPYYPGDFQLLVRWALALGTDAYAFVPSMAGAVLSLAALYGICRAVGQGRGTALVSTAAAASCSLVPFLATTVEADTMTTAFQLLATLLLLRWRRSSARMKRAGEPVTLRLGALAAFGASLGLAVGTKYSALPSALGLLAIASVVALRRSTVRYPDRRSEMNLRSFTIMLASIVVPLALCGGYWYLRNLAQHGNPVYPIAAAGLPGVDMRYVIPVKAALADNVWARMTYPWVQWDFVTPYDDGLGLAFAAVAVPAFVLVGLLQRRLSGERRMLWWITLGAYALWLGTGSITARFGLFPVLLTFAFVGELWRECGSWSLRALTVAAVMATYAVTTKSLVVGAVYTTVMPPGHRGIPAIVDSLPPSRIFNATSASNRYPLLGADYRHEVITMFRAARPEDADSSGASYMLLSAAQVPTFVRGDSLVRRGPPLPSGDTLSLWARSNRRGR